MEKLYRGNIDASLKLKNENELSKVWIRLSRSKKDPSNPHKYFEETMIQCYHPGEWQMLMKARAGNNPGPYKSRLNWPITSGWHEYEIMHDPSLTTDIKTLQI